ncbi:lytic murein transglycosylase [Novosphingobium chloroacetimidivorans]|uniref:Lytic murein transglycosylase n=1 Tax=Novosphingobium chloroacetimidivorans TaxID=1428314 RepID=A0A7W7NV09_9SPHN|nr:lytic murein transglycosylase [Novosphingobium chloroacetimidivorans]MBB4856804.1 lytic murein transglycosylase [Novosphingobium chloroacetimidivorans]
MRRRFPLRLLRQGLTCSLLAAIPLPAVEAQYTGAPYSNSGYSGSASFEGYLDSVRSRAAREGVSQATIGRMLSGLTPNPRVIQLDGGQPSRSSTPPATAPYIATHVDAARIGRGRERYARDAGMLPAIERRYGVPASIMLAIWGHETNYGSYTGDFDLARSLATLAWEGRRRALFEGELIAVLKMVDRGVPPYRLKGSWAGAFGNPQFLPSVYLRLAADGDGDGDADIWSSDADTLASIANYFRDAGWRPGQPWGVRASVSPGFSASGSTARLAAPSCDRVHARHSRWLTVAEWRRLGVTPQRSIGEDVLATFFQPDGPGTPAYLLTGNYRVILQYNCSNYYALSVGLLADEIAR